MPRINDQCLLKWSENGIEVEEEFVFYDSSDSEPCDLKEGADSTIVGVSENDLVDKVSEDFVSNNPIHQMCIMCLYDTIEKFAILKCMTKRAAAPVELKLPEYRTIADRFGDKIVYGEELYTEARKRYMDISLAYTILFATSVDLVKRGTLTALYEATSIMQRLTDEENSFLKDFSDNIIIENDLNRRMLTEGEELKKIYKEKLDELRKLEVEYEDTIGYATLELKYVEAWEASRRHQANIILERKGGEFQNIIDTFTLKTKQENLIHVDIVTYLEESIDDMQAEIQVWMERYEEETEQRDEDLLKTKINREKQQEKIQKLKYVYEERKAFIESWQEILEERKLRAEELRVQTLAALKIQAWWRGIMVRKKLGRYGKKKGKKGGKNKKGKKGKKLKK